MNTLTPTERTSVVLNYQRRSRRRTLARGHFDGCRRERSRLAGRRGGRSVWDPLSARPLQTTLPPPIPRRRCRPTAEQAEISTTDTIVIVRPSGFTAVVCYSRARPKFSFLFFYSFSRTNRNFTENGYERISNGGGAPWPFPRRKIWYRFSRISVFFFVRFFFPSRGHVFVHFEAFSYFDFYSFFPYQIGVWTGGKIRVKWRVLRRQYNMREYCSVF